MITPVKRWSLTELDVDKGAVHCLPGTKTMPGISLHSMKIFFILGALNSSNIFHHFYDHNNLRKNQQVNWQNNFVIFMHCWKRCICIGPEKGRCGLTVTLIERLEWDVRCLTVIQHEFMLPPQQVSSEHQQPEDWCLASCPYISASNPAHHHHKAAAIDD